MDHINDKLFNALGIFLDAMRPFAVSVIQKVNPDQDWEDAFYNQLNSNKQKQWNINMAHVISEGTSKLSLIDYNVLSEFAYIYKDQMAKETGTKSNASKFISCMKELEETRNKCQHYKPIDEDETERAFSNMKLVAKLLEMTELYDEIIKYSGKDEKGQTSSSNKVISTAAAQKQLKTDLESEKPVTDNGSALMPWFNNAMPHYDIRSGKLDESVFAANLNDVVNQTGPEVYNNAPTFFAKTFVTDGLRDIANRVVIALNGEQSENRVISLQTGFGGGKTHTMISLYHIARLGSKLLDIESCEGLLREKVTPKFNSANVAVFTNNTTDVIQGREIDEELTIHTLWGEIAYQLGGKDAYEKVKENDLQMIAPTTSILKPILANNAPAMILIDELADYCVKAKGKIVAKGTLYDQTISFVQTLTEAVSQTEKCVMIATLPESKTEVANSELGSEILQVLNNRIVRVGTNIKPVEDEEIFEVVRRRLFEGFSNLDEISRVAQRYKNTYHNRRTDLPTGSDNLSYINLIKKSYPFHPDLIDMFRLRWGNDSRFQRTRGVLRLLASIVQDLWMRRNSLIGPNALIHTSNVNLDELNALTGTITNLMGANWESVMHADVYGSSSNAVKIDSIEADNNIGKFHLTQGLATTILLSSVGGMQNKGLDMKSLKRCVLMPDAFNHNDIDGALNKLEQVAFYLYSSPIGGKTYWFDGKPNINTLVIQAKSEVSPEEIKNEIINRLRNSLGFVNGLNTLIAPPDNSIPEQKNLTMIILSPDYAVPVDKIPAHIKNYIHDISENRGTSTRIYRNTIFYLCCTELGKVTLNSKLQGLLGCQKILHDYSTTLDKSDKEELQKRILDYEKKCTDALIHAYDTVLMYSSKDGIYRYEIKTFASDMSSQISVNMMNEMQEEGKIINSIGRIVLKNNNLYPTEDKQISVNSIYESFRKFDDKPKIIGPEAVIRTVNKYCSEGAFKVAVINDGKITALFSNRTVDYLDVNSDEYWLVDNSVQIETDAPSSTQPTEPTQPIISTPEPNPDNTVIYKSITISGKVPVEYWTQLFTSFVNILKNNNLKIEIKFKAKTNAGYPLKENSATVKSVKESASQLGLDFEAEE